MYHSSFGEYKVEIINENDYVVGSADNRFVYELTYQHPEDIDYAATSTYGIKVYKNAIFKTAAILATGGATATTSDSALIDGPKLLLTCCNKVFCLELPELKLNWVLKADFATCFSIYKYKDDFVIHGETEITRLDQSGKIIWRVGARDIFVNTEHHGPTFKMHDDYIALMDWQGFRYKLSYDGIIADDGVASVRKIC